MSDQPRVGRKRALYITQQHGHGQKPRASPKTVLLLSLPLPLSALRLLFTLLPLPPYALPNDD